MLLAASCSRLLAPDVEREFRQLRTGNYRLDINHTAVIFKIQHLGLSTYVGRFNDVEAWLNFDPNDTASITLDAQVPVASLDVNNAELKETLLTGTWFDAERFPDIAFTSTGVSPWKQDNQWQLAGDLTLHGTVRPVTWYSTFHGGADNLLTGKYTLGFSATTSIKRSDFGMDSYLGMVGDEIQIEVYAEFQKVK